MKILQFDSIGGASGDMILGALFELGIEPSRLQSALAHLIPDAFEIRTVAFSSHGLHGTQTEISIPHHDHAHRTFTGLGGVFGGFGLFHHGSILLGKGASSKSGAVHFYRKERTF